MMPAMMRAAEEEGIAGVVRLDECLYVGVTEEGFDKGKDDNDDSGGESDTLHDDVCFR